MTEREWKNGSNISEVPPERVDSLDSDEYQASQGIATGTTENTCRMADHTFKRDVQLFASRRPGRTHKEVLVKRNLNYMICSTCHDGFSPREYFTGGCTVPGQ